MEMEVSATQYPDYGNQNDVIEMNSLTFEITKMFKILCIQIEISRTYNI